jgi:hypothetical protein
MSLASETTYLLRIIDDYQIEMRPKDPIMIFRYSDRKHCIYIKSEQLSVRLLPLKNELTVHLDKFNDGRRNFKEYKFRS